MAGFVYAATILHVTHSCVDLLYVYRILPEASCPLVTYMPGRFVDLSVVAFSLGLTAVY